MSDHAIPATHDRLRLAVEGEVCLRTVERAYRGEPIRHLCRLRIERAAQKLGLPKPPAGAKGAA